MDDALGLTRLERGESVRFEVPGIGPIEGTLFSRNDQSRSIRASNAMYRFIQGLFGPMVLSHIHFRSPEDPDPDTHEPQWQAWVNRLYH
jgi:hypothetical protein